MFVDISGFTRLTETLMKQRKYGAEVLTEVLNFIFNPIVKNIYGNGGIITSYAGDAFTAVFWRENDCINPDFQMGIIKSSLFIDQYLKNNKVINTRFGNFNIAAKVGLSFGRVQWRIVKTTTRNLYYFKGPGIKGCLKSEHKADKGEVIVDYNLVNAMKIDRKYLEQKGKGFYILNPEFKYSEFINNNSIFPQISKEELEPFVSETVLNFQGKAEFREVTSIFISFDESAAESKINKFLKELTHEANLFGGYFNKVDYGDKGGVALIIFGAPKSYENNIERTLDFILNIKNKINYLKFKAGITNGIVYAGIIGGEERCEYTVIGDIVNLSSRYMMRAPWGGIWIDEYLKKNSEHLYNFHPVGNYTFKGSSAKITIFELISKKKVDKDLIFEGSFIGRNHEITKLEKYLKPIFKGNFAGIIYVYGEAGIGKSRLIWELRKSTEDLTTWFYCPCEKILKRSFYPLISFLKQYFKINEENSTDKNFRNYEQVFNNLVNKLQKKNSNEAVRDTISELKRTKAIIGGYLGLSWKESLFNQIDAKARHENFIYAVKNLIKAESLLKPVILDFDDIHQIDLDTQEFIEILIRNILNYPIGIICTARYNDNGSYIKLECNDNIKTHRIDLNFLNKSDIAAYTKSVLNTDKQLSTYLLDFIDNKTNGNPFFIEQLLLSMKESNFIKLNKDNELYTDEAEIKNIPSNIQAVVVSRLDRLSEDVKEVIQTASILGRVFLIKILSNILKGDKSFDIKISYIENEKIWFALNEIKYIFKHALLRDAAYDMQLRSTLKKLHKLAAESYEKLFQQDLERYYGDIAYHYQKAEIAAKTIYYLEKAGDYAKENYKNEEAIEFYSNLIWNHELSVEHAIDIKIKVSKVLELIGQRTKAEEIVRESLAEAELLDHKKYIALCCNSLGWLIRIRGNYKEAIKYINIALNLRNEVNDLSIIANVYGNMGALFWNQGLCHKAIECFQKDLEICEELGEITRKGKAIANLGLVQWQLSNYQKATEYMEKALIIFKKLDDKWAIGTIIGNMGLIYKDIGDYLKAMKCFNQSLKICQQVGDKEGVSRAIGNKGLLYTNQGEYQKAMECHEKSLEVYRELGDKRTIGIVIGNIGLVYENQNQLEKAMQYYRNSLKICMEVGNQDEECRIVGNLGYIYCYQGDYVKAEDYYKRQRKLCKELGLSDYEVNLAILKEKINFGKSKFKQDKFKCIENLKELLTNLKDMEQKADVNFQICLFLQALNEKYSKYRKEAMDMYEQLYNHTPRIAFKKRYLELEKL